jgi:hypothetical protein
MNEDRTQNLPRNEQPQNMKNDPDNTPLDTKRKRYTLQAFVGLSILLIIGALLNPGQEKHLEALRKVTDAKKLSESEVPSEVVVRISKYRDYFVFSTVIFGENNLIQEPVTISYGFLGAVKTTSRINDVLYAISQWEKTQAQTPAPH